MEYFRVKATAENIGILKAIIEDEGVEVGAENTGDELVIFGTEQDVDEVKSIFDQLQ